MSLNWYKENFWENLRYSKFGIVGKDEKSVINKDRSVFGAQHCCFYFYGYNVTNNAQLFAYFFY